jgi:prepilin-type N-terminal cleavage/methylation domain-containing protein/prepilin-type processing-associated H-X9-DG protein
MKNTTDGFTLLELVVVAGIASVLVMLLATAAANSHPNVRVVQCLANMKQLTAAWTMYAHDHSDRVPNNFGIPDTMDEIVKKSYRTWACNVMQWTTDSGVTNEALLRLGLLGPYINGDTRLYRCPSDNYLASPQIAAGWTARARSVSMNAFFGPDRATGGSWQSGKSSWAGPSYRQWLKTGEVPEPSQFFVLLDEHPDSINDALFLNNPGTSTSWGDIPSSYHNGGCTISFADGRAEVHKWLSNSSKIPVQYSYMPVAFDQLGRADHAWLMTRATVLWR